MPIPRSARPVHQERSRATLEGLLDATEALLREGGLETATVETIARRAGVSTAIVYRRFPDKDALLRAVFERYFERVERANDGTLQDRPCGRPSTDEAVRLFIRGALAGAATERQLVRSLWSFASRHPDAEFRAEAQRLNARSHAGLTRLLLETIPPAERERKAPGVWLAVDVLLLALRGFLVEEVPPSGVAPDEETLVNQLGALVGAYLAR